MGENQGILVKRGEIWVEKNERIWVETVKIWVKIGAKIKEIFVKFWEVWRKKFGSKMKKFG